MKYVQLGRSGLIVSQICLGGNSWGAAGRREWGAFDAAGSRPFFRAALDASINFFDTADVYNHGVSESVMGSELIPMVPRDDLVISTKIGIPMSGKPNDGGLGRKHLMKSLDAALKRLKTDYVDLLQVHRLDAHTPLAETMRTLDDMVRAGKVRYIGGSTMPAYKFAQMIALADRYNLARPIAMQNLYNLVQREDEREMLRLCAEEGVGAIPYSPLARGFLAGNRSRDGGGETERAKTDKAARGLYRPTDFDVVDQVVALARRRGVRPTQIALAWLLHKPVVSAPIIGATKPEYIAEAAAATEIALSVDEIASLEAPYAFGPAPMN
ncbi:MAG: aldo/keto reductase [Hyphomicrobiales bacterium]|jgi:1-deoxyxylulose-5-phosphate synthase|nr:aldo/keto reductase [Hyphomicrobiales bacterium]